MVMANAIYHMPLLKQKWVYSQGETKLFYIIGDQGLS